MRAPEVGALTASQLPPNVPMTLIRTCARHTSIHALIQRSCNPKPSLLKLMLFSLKTQKISQLATVQYA